MSLTYSSSATRVAPAHTRGTLRATVAFAAAAMLVSYLPFSGVNGALGSIRVDTGASTTALQWVTDAFTLALAGAVLVGGSLSGRLGFRCGTLLGLAFTVLGCVLGGFGGSDVRVLQMGQAAAGIGAGIVMSATLGLITATAPSADARGRAIGVWAAANVVGLGVGPFLSAAAAGAIRSDAAWRCLFAPVALMAVLVGCYGLLRSRAPRPGPTGGNDLAGQVLGAATSIAVVNAVIRGGSTGWTSTGTLVAIAASASLAAILVYVERRDTNPVLPPALFRSRGFLAAACASAAALFTMIGIVFLLGVGLDRHGLDSLDIAERIGCLFAGNAVASVVSNGLQRRWGHGVVLVGALSVAALGLLSMLRLDFGTDMSLADQGWRLVAIGAGCGCAVATSTVIAILSVPIPLATAAGTVNNVLRQVGGALGTAVIGGILATQLTHGVNLTNAFHACVLALAGVVALATVATAFLLFGPTIHWSRSSATTI